MLATKINITDRFQIKGRGTVFTATAKENPHVDLGTLTNKDVEIEGKMYKVTAVEAAYNNFGLVAHFGLVVREL